MNTKQKIAFLLADYTVRVIAARQLPKFAELEPIRSIETAAVANTAAYAAYTTADAAYAAYAAYVAYYAAYAAYYAANAARAAYAADAANAARAASNAVVVANIIAIVKQTSDNYAIDIRELINIAVDPDRYW